MAASSLRLLPRPLSVSLRHCRARSRSTRPSRSLASTRARHTAQASHASPARTLSAESTTLRKCGPWNHATTGRSPQKLLCHPPRAPVIHGRVLQARSDRRSVGRFGARAGITCRGGGVIAQVARRPSARPNDDPVVHEPADHHDTDQGPPRAVLVPHQRGRQSPPQSHEDRQNSKDLLPGSAHATTSTFKRQSNEDHRWCPRRVGVCPRLPVSAPAATNVPG
jgi:hypothetical protein